ncbi:response regulator transcription factor [Saltatorellus ferox]|uniref:helix-turn-helix transcriptional regulator n=1 Tax=Saltatorellus ferox TaxID=2528018 RepID=UPI003AF377ED
MTNREWKALDLYHHVYAKMGVEDQVVVCAPMPAPMALGVTISRSRRGFKSAEVGALEIYEKHFTHAFELEQRFADWVWLADNLAQSRNSREGFAIANSDGAVQIACPTTELLLARYFPIKRLGTRHLPESLLDRIKRLSSTEESRLHTSTVVRVLRGEHELRIDLRRQARLNRWILRFEEQTPKIRRRREAEAFSPRLKSVVDLLREGHSEKAIAHELALAATTVHDYVKQIFKRLGVHSRSEFMALWIDR